MVQIFQQKKIAKKILIILPHAGGNANYYREVVQYPGRQERLFDSMITFIDGYADKISQILNLYKNRQIIIFWS